MYSQPRAICDAFDISRHHEWEALTDFADDPSPDYGKDLIWMVCARCGEIREETSAEFRKRRDQEQYDAYEARR